MRRISKEEAIKLIDGGEAGWYAVDANPPVAHDTLIVVSVGTDDYLCTADEVAVKIAGPVRLPNGLVKFAYEVNVLKDSSIAALLQAAMGTKPQVDLGTNTPALMTGSRKGP